ncbi:MAG: MFS transporter [Anaerolineae bacterium]|nr:MFS transporter [Anaerolineae bacterium]
MSRKRVVRTLLVSNFFMGVGFNIWMAVFNNFAVEELAIGPAQMGILQSLREVPGVLGFATSYLALFASELTLATASVVATGVGLALMGLATGMLSLLAYLMVFSTGFHIYHPASSAVALMESEGGDTPRLLGRMGSVNAAAAVLATAFVFFAVGPLGFRHTLMLTGLLTALGGLFCLRSGHRVQVRQKQQKVVFRARYWVFYALTFLMGSRRHIFSTFAIFLLVNTYGIRTQTTAVLFLASSLLVTYVASLQGRLVAQLGERVTMTAYFVTIVLICLGYAYVSWLPLLYVLFVGDSVMAGFGIAVNSYFRKIAPASEVTANMSMSQTINHIAALFVPALGGLMWQRFGFQSTFLFGAAVAGICLVVSQWLRVVPAPAATVAEGVSGAT